MSATTRFKLYTVAEVMNEPSPEWRVEGLLPAGALSMIYAPQAQFKTFMALDIALCVANGIPFQGRNVKAGPTVYVLGEGRGGLKNRVNAWLKRHGIDPSESGATFVLEAVQFKNAVDVAALKAQILALNLKPAMVFIDTFARSAVGVDENDARDVGAWIDAVTRLKADLDCDVVAIHHAQKGNGEGGPVRERGSSAFIGAVDTVIRLTRKNGGNLVTISCEKQKDAEEFKPFRLRAKVVSLGKNEHGQDTSSYVLEAPDAADEMAAIAEDAPLSVSERSALAVLVKAGRLASGDWRDQISDEEGKAVTDRTFQNWRKGLVTKGFVQKAEDSSYEPTVKGRATATGANGMPLSCFGKGPSSACHATPPKGVAGGIGRQAEVGIPDLSGFADSEEDANGQ